MRRITERLEGYAFAVALQQQQDTTPAAQVAEIVFVDNPDDPAHTVVVPLTAAGKQHLLAQLTGGLVVST